jgi:hypothetical protein
MIGRMFSRTLKARVAPHLPSIIALQQFGRPSHIETDQEFGEYSGGRFVRVLEAREMDENLCTKFRLIRRRAH